MRRMEEQASPRYIDIFAGCGGLSLGLYNAGWKGMFAIEKSKHAFETLKHNLIDNKHHFDWPDWLEKKEYDINDVLSTHEENLKNLSGKIDLVAGGPPCQGFSFAGKRNKDDERNDLVNSYVKFIELIKPKMLFFENVKGFTCGFKDENGDTGEPYSNQVMLKLKDLGYNIEHKIVDFSEFGIPQRRKRFIIVGMLDSNPSDFFEDAYGLKESFLSGKGLKEKVTLDEAISDLNMCHGEVPSPDSKGFKSATYGEATSAYQKYMREGFQKDIPDSHRFAKHKPDTIKKFQYIIDNCEKNKNVDDTTKTLYKLKKSCITLLDGNSQCPTLTTLPDDYVHYSEPRILTVREYARIQSFNDWFELKSKYTTGGKNRVKDVPRYSQLGNAIPPLFVEHFGVVLKKYIEN